MAQLDTLSAQRTNLVAAHAGVDPYKEYVAHRRFEVESFEARTPSGQYLGQRRKPPSPHFVEAPPGGQPQFDRIPQTLMVDTWPAVD